MARPASTGPRFEFYGQALQAAADGLGVAMGIRPYIDDDIAAGRLVAPFALSVPKGESWYLVYRTVRMKEPGFSAFRAWIVEAAAVALSGEGRHLAQSGGRPSGVFKCSGFECRTSKV